MKYLSVCSGIEAATVAWHDLGFTPVGFSEIEPFPSAVLAHHYPNVTNFGDMTKYKEWNIGTDRLDILVGGTPCQSFSVAGLRKGLDDPRGNLALSYCGILAYFRPKWFVWENVPGVLSSSGGRDFGSFLGAVAELGYGFSYRVLDAQYFGVAQRRRRVFVVGYLGNWRPPAAVLFERESLSRDTAPRREKREDVAGTIAARFGISRNNHEECVAATIQARMGGGGFDLETETPILTYALETSACLETTSNDYSRADGFTAIVQPMNWNIGPDSVARPDKIASTLDTRCVDGPRRNQGGTIVAQPFRATADCLTSAYGTKWNGNASADNGSLFVAQPVAMRESGLGYWMEDTVAGTLDANMGMSGHANRPAVIKQASMAVRRLTPVECERLQGFPDNYTNIPWRKKDESPDGPRYKALGNSMAVPVMHWIGKNIKKVSQKC